MAKTTFFIVAAFCISALQAMSLTRPASPESELAAIKPIPIEISELPQAPQAEILPSLPVEVSPEIIIPQEDPAQIIRPLPVEVNPEVIVPEIEVLPVVPEEDPAQIIRPLPVEVSPEIIVPEIEVLPVVPQEDPVQIIRPLPVEVNPISPEIEVLPAVPEAEACQVEGEAEEVPQIPEIEIVVPEAPQVKPQPIVPEVPEIEVILPEAPEVVPEVEACEAAPGLVRPLPEAVIPGIQVAGSQGQSAVAPQVVVALPQEYLY